MTFPESVRGWQPTWFYCKDVPSPGSSTSLPPFSSARLNAPRSLTVAEEEKAEVGILVEAVVELIRGGVTGLDLLEVFLSRRIQPQQAQSHPMWQ
jgi:hypothetical protein